MHLAPNGFGDGEQLAGGPVRFARLRLTVGGNESIVAPDALARAITALPAEVRTRLETVRDRLLAPRAPIAGLVFDRAHVMGIVNVTPDSFADTARGGDPVAAARAMAAAGASIVDLGGESTRPRAMPVSTSEELARVEPVLERLRGGGLTLSIDTRKADVMAAALDRGAAIVNDVSALTHDPAALGLVAARGCPVVLMHAQGEPATMQDAPHYDDVLWDVFDWLDARIERCVAAGIDRSRIIVDPGIGFGKTIDHNLVLLRGLEMFHGLGCPILLGVSRKTMIGALSDDAPVGDRLGGSLALALHGISRGIQIVRVHDVPETVQAVRLWEATR